MKFLNRIFKRRTAKDDILELLHRAYMYDDKPHRLYSWIGALATIYEDDPNDRAEIIRLMDIEYYRDRSNRGI